MADFLLVQQMTRSLMHEGPITKPEHLCTKYMGRAEFEFGAIPRSYKAMRSQKLVLTNVKIRAFDTEATLHVVAPADQADSLQRRFQTWFDGGLPSKENPHLDRAITHKGWRGDALSDEDLKQLPIAWWALNENVFFSLEEGVAKMWHDAMHALEAVLPMKSSMFVY